MSASKCGPFNKEEQLFIINEFARSPTKLPTDVKRAFRLKFKDSRTARALREISLFAYSRVLKKFEKNGIKESFHPGQVRGANKTDENKIKLVEDHFIQNPMDSVAQASIALDIHKSSIYRILRKKTKLKPYKICLSQKLTILQKEQRLALCQWIVEQDDETISQIIFRDEKWFQLNQHPNRQNTRYWGVSKPTFVYDVKTLHVAKIMAFVIVIEGKAHLFWHVDENGKNVSVNTDQYIKSVIDVIEDLDLGKLNSNYIWQQDGASCHTSNKTLAFLKRIFKDRIISRNEKIEGMPEWSANSPDLNPLDFCFWGLAMSEVWKKKPKTIPELKKVVEDFFNNLGTDFVKNCVLNIRKRAQLCVQEQGGHFEHLL
jgi:hypothetical protein